MKDRLAFPKPKDEKRGEQPPVRIYRDGREVCQNNKAGRIEYALRVDTMLRNQGGKCGLQITLECKAIKGRLSRSYAQFGHPRSRGFGGGKRDDRLTIDGKPSGAKALCSWCNIKQSSRPITDFDEVVI